MPSTSYIDFPAAVSALQDRTNAAGVDQTDVTGEDLRLLARFFTPGVKDADDFVVVSGAGLSVDVGTDADDLAIVEGTDPGQGNYAVRMGVAPPYNVPLSAAHSTNDRIDQIYLVILDQQYDGGTLTLARIARRTGDAAASPVEPGPDAAWTAFLLLATVLVENGDTAVAPGNITDERALTTPEPHADDHAPGGSDALDQYPRGFDSEDTTGSGANQNIENVSEQITGLSLTFNRPTARKVRVTVAYVGSCIALSGGRCQLGLGIRVDGTQIESGGFVGFEMRTVGEGNSGTFVGWATLPAGAHTITLWGSNSVGGGSIAAVYLLSTKMMVEDLGPA